VPRSFLAGRAALITPAAIVIVASTTVSTAQTVRVAIAATPPAPQVVGRCLGAAWNGLIGQSGSGQHRYRDGGEKGISQKCSHLKSPWLVSIHGHVSSAGREWFMENAELLEA
jgi:hypothetical protein